MSTKHDLEQANDRFRHAHDTHLAEAEEAVAAAVRQLDACNGELEHFRDGKRSKPEADDLMAAFGEARSLMLAARRAVDRLAKAVAEDEPPAEDRDAGKH